MTDVEIVATVAFATGQLKDPDAVAWLAELLIGGRRRPPAVAREAAQALGKIRTPEARTALAQYLTVGALRRRQPRPSSARRCSPSGDSPTRDDLAPIVKWTTAPTSRFAGARRGRSSGRAIRPRSRASSSSAATRRPRCGSGRCAVWRRLWSRRRRQSREGRGAPARRRPRSRSPRAHRGAARARAVRRRRLVWRSCWRRSSRRTRGSRCRRPNRSDDSRRAPTWSCRVSSPRPRPPGRRRSA